VGDHAQAHGKEDGMIAPVKPRYPRLLALDVAREIIDALAPACSRICFAGSLRREKADVGDIEILYIPATSWPRELVNLADNTIARLEKDGILERRLNVKGRETFGRLNKLMRHIASGIPVDLFAASFDNWFNRLVCLTGPKELNQRICREALRIGWGWNPAGVGFTAKDSGQVARMESEEDVFDFVGIPFCEPKDRR